MYRFNFNNKHHVPQQQHKLLNSYNNNNNNNAQLSISTSSSRTVSMAPSVNTSCASTPVSVNNMMMTTINNNNKRMLMPIQRQENVKSSNETLCSLNDSATFLQANTKQKQFQHELLDQYNKQTTTTTALKSLNNISLK